MTSALDRGRAMRREIAERVATRYVSEHVPLAVLLTGSVALGEDDDHSDVDLIAYYARVPERDALDATRERLGGAMPQEGDAWAPDHWAQTFTLDGTEIQITHVTIDTWERDIARVLDDLDTESPLQKALAGILDGVALHGHARIAEWHQRLRAYPDELARAMVRRNLRVFPLWYVDARLASRDAVLWRQRELVTAAERILAVLSGLNRVYFSTFQFKRLRRHVAGFAHAPDRLAERLEALFVLPPSAAAQELHALVAETLALVEREMPDVDTAEARRYL